jgi:hypothetical protein
MTGLTSESRGDVTLMREVNEVRKLMDPHPFDRAILAPSFLDFFDQWALGLHDLMAVHANTDGRHRSVARLLYVGVTVLAGNLIISGVNLMTERDRLRWRIPLV